jgi:hypothetical protein
MEAVDKYAADFLDLSRAVIHGQYLIALMRIICC